jgi:hypothetical protein
MSVAEVVLDSKVEAHLYPLALWPPESESSQYRNFFLTFGIYCKFKSYLYQNHLATEICKGSLYGYQRDRARRRACITARFGFPSASKTTTRVSRVRLYNSSPVFGFYIARGCGRLRATYEWIFVEPDSRRIFGVVIGGQTCPQGEPRRGWHE